MTRPRSTTCFDSDLTETCSGRRLEYRDEPTVQNDPRRNWTKSDAWKFRHRREHRVRDPWKWLFGPKLNPVSRQNEIELLEISDKVDETVSLKQADRSAGDRTQNSKKSADDGTQNAYGLTVNAVNENDERSTAAVAATMRNVNKSAVDKAKSLEKSAIDEDKSLKKSAVGEAKSVEKSAVDAEAKNACRKKVKKKKKIQTGADLSSSEDESAEIRRQNPMTDQVRKIDSKTGNIVVNKTASLADLRVPFDAKIRQKNVLFEHKESKAGSMTDQKPARLAKLDPQYSLTDFASRTDVKVSQDNNSTVQVHPAEDDVRRLSEQISPIDSGRRRSIPMTDQVSSFGVTSRKANPMTDQIRSPESKMTDFSTSPIDALWICSASLISTEGGRGEANNDRISDKKDKFSDKNDPISDKNEQLSNKTDRVFDKNVTFSDQAIVPSARLSDKNVLNSTSCDDNDNELDQEVENYLLEVEQKMKDPPPILLLPHNKVSLIFNPKLVFINRTNPGLFFFIFVVSLQLARSDSSTN